MEVHFEKNLQADDQDREARVAKVLREQRVEVERLLVQVHCIVGRRLVHFEEPTHRKKIRVDIEPEIDGIRERNLSANYTHPRHQCHDLENVIEEIHHVMKIEEVPVDDRTEQREKCMSMMMTMPITRRHRDSPGEPTEYRKN